MTQADEDEEIDLNGPSVDEEIGDDVEDIDVEAEVDDVVDGSGDTATDDDDEEVIDKPRGKRVAAEPIAVEDVANIEARRHVREQLE